MVVYFFANVIDGRLMVEKHRKLDNLSAQVIKEMINRNELSIEQIDTLALDALFKYESAIFFVGKSDDELLCQIAKLLDSVNYTNDAEQKYNDLIRNTLEPRTS